MSWGGGLETAVSTHPGDVLAVAGLHVALNKAEVSVRGTKEMLQPCPIYVHAHLFGWTVAGLHVALNKDYGIKETKR